MGGRGDCEAVAAFVVFVVITLAGVLVLLGAPVLPFCLLLMVVLLMLVVADCSLCRMKHFSFMLLH